MIAAWRDDLEVGASSVAQSCARIERAPRRVIDPGDAVGEFEVPVVSGRRPGRDGQGDRFAGDPRDLELLRLDFGLSHPRRNHPLCATSRAIP